MKVISSVLNRNYLQSQFCNKFYTNVRVTYHLKINIFNFLSKGDGIYRSVLPNYATTNNVHYQQKIEILHLKFNQNLDCTWFLRIRDTRHKIKNILYTKYIGRPVASVYSPQRSYANTQQLVSYCIQTCNYKMADNRHTHNTLSTDDGKRPWKLTHKVLHSIKQWWYGDNLKFIYFIY